MKPRTVKNPRSILFLAIQALLSLLPLAAAHADFPSVLIVTTPVVENSDRAAAQLLSYGLRQAIRSDRRYRIAQISRLYGEKPLNSMQLVREADALAKQGQLAFDNLEIEKAQQNFEQALTLYEELLDDKDATKNAARIALMAAGSALVANDEGHARNWMQRALLYDRTVTPSTRIYDANMLAIFNDVRKQVLVEQKIPLTLESDPTGSEIYLDDAFIGVSPVTLPSVALGQHLVRVIHAGYRPYLQVVDVTAASMGVTLRLKELPKNGLITTQARQYKEKPVLAPALAAYGDWAASASATDVLYVTAQSIGSQIKAKAVLFNVATHNRVVREAILPTGNLKDFATDSGRLWSNLVEGLFTEGAATKRSIVKPAVSWSLVGFGGASLLVGTTFGVLALRQNQTFRQLPQNSPDLALQQSSLKTKAIVSDLFLSLGAASTLAGIICLVAWDDKPKEREFWGRLPVKFNVAWADDSAAVTFYGRF